MTERLYQNYKNDIVTSLQKKFNYKNVMEIPRIDKVVINMGIGEAVKDSKKIETAQKELSAITGQFPIITKAKKANASFKLREGMAVGLKVDDNSSSYRDGFVYIETTGNSPIGKIPEKFAGGISILDEEPVILYVDVVGSNYQISGFNELNKFYNDVEEIYGSEYFYNSFEGKVLIEKISSIKNNSNQIKDLMDLENLKIKNFRTKINALGGCTGTLEKNLYDLCLPLNDSLNARIDNYNNIVQKYNSVNFRLNSLINEYNTINSDNYIKN